MIVNKISWEKKKKGPLGVYRYKILNESATLEKKINVQQSKKNPPTIMCSKILQEIKNAKKTFKTSKNSPGVGHVSRKKGGRRGKWHHHAATDLRGLQLHLLHQLSASEEVPLDSDRQRERYSLRQVHTHICT